jgi:hypothetical protein
VVDQQHLEAAQTIKTYEWARIPKIAAAHQGIGTNLGTELMKRCYNLLLLIE